MKLRPSYKPMEITLIKKDKRKIDLRNDLDVSSATLAKMSRGEAVSLSVIIKICEYLECQIQDVVELVEVNDSDS
ncbi:helix-turn-helix domain-containing protein [Bacillus subtilis]|uniref:helix-turn-helix domain-containing protein n=1 Tax=Bacillus subtilis TaxID=1423 RepID=UPI00061F9588|nr:helix-turn-helix domain-containing protein [Bacillus subtilis]KJJ40453.1 XRE family transcriptional regulator [Bacillus subtilis]MDH3084224.1 helix-turn-helix domain-containing protein [Bacillus subtilis]MED4874558.1 helix-turn-helix domain-containing protein [Bacillus subtilis]WEY91484.1 helix-turn-helix domain-containing protein [Bacillus subtilis]WGD57067.1 helix-turn-helix domain-containing protein [Bacillus subtilis]